jgi:hypothetical protein
MNPIEFDDPSELIVYALKNNCSREIYDLLIKAFTDSVKILFFFNFKSLFISSSMM